MFTDSLQSLDETIADYAALDSSTKPSSGLSRFKPLM
jgi:hypothetical protein